MRWKIKTGNTEKEESSHLHAYCARCRHRHVFVRTAVNHGFHLFLSVITFGLWLVSWVAVCIGRTMRPWRCEHCGWHKPEFRMPCDQVERSAQNLAPGASETYVQS